MLGDLKSPRLIYTKGALFLVAAGIAAGLLLVEKPTWRVGLLLAMAIWCSCRFYYFAFYVIEHYVDRRYRFDGLWSFAMYLVRGPRPENDWSENERSENEPPKDGDRPKS